MCDDGCLDPSYLISKLVFLYKPNDLKALERAVDIIRSIQSEAEPKKISYYQKNWGKLLENRGKSNFIPQIKSEIGNLKKNLNRPNQILTLLHLFIENSDNLDNHPHIIESRNLPTDFLLVLQGMNGKEFIYNEKLEKFILVSNVNPHVLSIANRISSIGCMVKFLNSYLQAHQTLVQLQFSTVVEEILHHHRQLVSSIESLYSTLTLPQLSRLLKCRSIYELEAATIICSTIGENGSGVLINKLHEITYHGDSVLSEISKRAHDASMKVITKMIRDWTSKGYIDDPYDEFFVKVKIDATNPSEWWNDMYFVDNTDVPSHFPEKFIHQIFTSGKCLNFMRKWDNPVELGFDEDLPLEEYVDLASTDANKLIIDFIVRRRNLLQSIQDIWDYVLLHRGDFANEFLKSGAAGPGRLARIAAEVARREINGLEYRFESDGEGLNFIINGPESVILSEHAMNVYKNASRFLMKIVHSSYALSRHHIERKHRKQSLLEFEAINFVNVVLAHFQQLVSTTMVSLIDGISKSNSFEEILSMNEKALNDIIQACWLTKGSRELRELLYEALVLVEGITIDTDTVDNERTQLHKLIFELKKKIDESSATYKQLARSLQLMFPLAFQ